MLEGLANTPGLVVVQHSNELPFPAPRDVKGVLWRGDIYLVSNNLGASLDKNNPVSEIEVIRQTVAHELIGHFGLRGFFGTTLDTVLNDIHDVVQAVEIENTGIVGKDPIVSGQFQSGSEAESSPPSGVSSRLAQMIAGGKGDWFSMVVCELGGAGQGLSPRQGKRSPTFKVQSGLPIVPPIDVLIDWQIDWPIKWPIVSKNHPVRYEFLLGHELRSRSLKIRAGTRFRRSQ